MLKKHEGANKEMQKKKEKGKGARNACHEYFTDIVHF